MAAIGNLFGRGKEDRQGKVGLGGRLLSLPYLMDILCRAHCIIHVRTRKGGAWTCLFLWARLSSHVFVCMINNSFVSISTFVLISKHFAFLRFLSGTTIYVFIYLHRFITKLRRYLSSVNFITVTTESDSAVSKDTPNWESSQGINHELEWWTLGKNIGMVLGVVDKNILWRVFETTKD